MDHRVRRLTRSGIEAFREYLQALRDGSKGDPPLALLNDRERSEPFTPSVDVEHRSFPTRLDAARYLVPKLSGADEVNGDVGLWTWLSLFYFDCVCPQRPDGRRLPGRDYRHVLEPGYRYGHRHLLSGAVLVYRLHGEKARICLGTKVDSENSFHHELVSRQALVSNPAIIGVVDILYFDERTGRLKRGAQAVEKDQGGTIRRFVDVIEQLDVNYDLYSMSSEALVDLLPGEFDRWKMRP